MKKIVSLYEHPLNSEGWALLALEYPLLSRDKASEQLVYGFQEKSREKMHEPFYIFSRSGKLAKFGIRRFVIDNYGTIIHDTSTYEIIEYKWSEKDNLWEQTSITEPHKKIPDNINSIIEIGSLLGFFVNSIPIAVDKILPPTENGLSR